MIRSQQTRSCSKNGSSHLLHDLPFRAMLASALFLCLVQLASPLQAASRGPLNNGSGNEGEISAENPKDTWSFTAVAGENILLRFASTNFVGLMELFGPDGTSMAYSIGNDTVIPSSWEPALAITNSGSFVVEVSSYNSADVGSYRLGLAQPSKPWTVPAGKKGGPLANGDNVGALTLGSLDFWSFTAEAGENILLRFASTTFVGRMELFGPNGASLAANGGNDTVIPGGWAQALVLTNSGTFTVVVSSFDSGYAGPYRLSLAQPSKPWTVPAGQEGGPLANGVNLGTLALGNLDFWSFSAKAGENVILRFASADFAGRLELFGPDGASLGVDAGADVAVPNIGGPSLAVTNSGTFTVVVSSYNSGGTGSYRLSLAQPSKPWTVPAGQEGGSLANGVNLGTLAAGAMDFWSFTAVAGENIIVRLASTNFTGRLELFGPNGASLGLNAGEDTAIPYPGVSSLAITNSGTFTVVVSSYVPREAGSYWLSLAQPSRPWTVPAGKSGGPLANGVNVGTLTLGAMDYWSFTAVAGENIILRLASADFAGRLELFGPDGASLAFRTGTDIAIPYPGAQSFVVTNSGTFAVVVSGYNSGDIGSYRLSLAQPSRAWTVPAGHTGGPLTNGVNVGTLAPGGLDFWSFTAKAGENIIMRFASADFSGRMELFGPDGASLAFTTGPDAAIPATGDQAFAVKSGGSFTVVVSGYNWDDAGSYRLSLAQPSKPWTIPAGHTGGPLTNGVNVGTLALGGMDFWSFTAKAGEDILLRFASTDFFGRLELFGPEGASLVYAIGADAAIPNTGASAFAVMNSGTFTVVVSSYNWGDAGSYRLNLAQPSKQWSGAAGTGGGPLANGVNVGTLTLGDMHAWSFTANAGENVVLRFASTNFIGRFELFGPDGVSLMYGLGADVALPYSWTPSFAVTTNGIFTVVVSSYNWGDAGSYWLTFAQPSKPWTVPAGHTGGPLGSELNAGKLALGGMDFWSFTAKDGENIRLRFASAEFQGRLELFGSDGASLALGTGSDVAVPNTDSPSLTVTKGGSFTVVVSSYAPNDAGSYLLRFAHLPGSFVVPQGDEGGALPDSIASGWIGFGDVDTWRFTACKDENFLVRLAPSANCFPRLDLYGPEGNLLASGASRDEILIPHRATNCGTYMVVVTSYLLMHTGGYQLSVDGHSDSLILCPPRVAASQANLTGAGGTADATVVLYTTTNITVPPVVWTPFATNRFDQFGVLDVNHAFDADPPRYFRALMPR